MCFIQLCSPFRGAFDGLYKVGSSLTLRFYQHAMSLRSVVIRFVSAVCVVSEIFLTGETKVLQACHVALCCVNIPYMVFQWHCMVVMVKETARIVGIFFQTRLSIAWPRFNLSHLQSCDWFPEF